MWRRRGSQCESELNTLNLTDSADAVWEPSYWLYGCGSSCVSSGTNRLDQCIDTKTIPGGATRSPAQQGVCLSALQVWRRWFSSLVMRSFPQECRWRWIAAWVRVLAWAATRCCGTDRSGPELHCSSSSKSTIRTKAASVPPSNPIKTTSPSASLSSESTTAVATTAQRDTVTHRVLVLVQITTQQREAAAARYPFIGMSHDWANIESYGN